MIDLNDPDERRGILVHALTDEYVAEAIRRNPALYRALFVDMGDALSGDNEL